MKKVPYILRDIEISLKRYVKQFPVVALTGPRQSGKSTTLKQLFGQKYKYLSFEDPNLRERVINDPPLFIDTLSDKVIFDEIQYFPEIIPYIKMKVDANRSRKGQFILTGSHQFLLMKHLTESLAGRVGLLNLLPLSINEQLNWKKTKTSNTLNVFQTSSVRGFYPELTINPSFEPADWYASYIQTYLEKDVRLIQNIGQLRDFHRFVTLLAGRCAQVINMSSYAKEIGVSVPTIKQWLSVLEASYIIYLLPAYFNNRGKSIVKSSKVYFIDIGLVCYLIGLKTKEQIINSPYIGAIFENFCMQEFFKNKFHKNTHQNLFFWRTRNDKEVDLILEEGQDLALYEFKFSKSIKPIMSSGITSFMETNKNKSIKSSKLLSLVEDTFYLTKNVHVENAISALTKI